MFPGVFPVYTTGRVRPGTTQQDTINDTPMEFKPPHLVSLKGVAVIYEKVSHWSPLVPVSVWLPEPARDRGSKQETLNDDFYHTTSPSAAIFGVQTVLSYLVLTLN